MVFEGLGPDMGSRTYEKGQELLLFLHAGGKAPVLGEISENLKFHRISGKSQNSIGIQKKPINYCFPVKSTPSRNLVFLREYWCFCARGRPKAEIHQILQNYH